MDVYGDLGVRPIINAGGTLTRLSGSVMREEVATAMRAASGQFVDMRELHEAAGRRLAELIGVEAAHVCACATAGIAVMAAAVMAGTDRALIRRLPDTTGMRSRFIALKAHRNAFDQAIRLAGGTFVDVEASPDALAEALSMDGIAGFFYTFSWFNTEAALPLPEVVAICRDRGVPVLVDAAAEVPPVENLRQFAAGDGADLVAFSGGKALRGPQSSGIILGRRDLVAACGANDSPNMSIGRGMKAGKEEIVGVVKAVELYLNSDHEGEMSVWEERVAHILGAVSDIEDVRGWRQLPFGLGQQIPHAAVSWDPAKLGATHEEVTAELKDGDPRVAVQLIDEPIYAFARRTGAEIRLHPHTLMEGQVEVVARRLREVLTASRGG